jgi:hypothetical protein
VATRHGRFAQILLRGTDISQYINASDFATEVENADTTTFGTAYRTNIAGLQTSTFTMEGFYDPTASTGPVALIEESITQAQGGTPSTVIFRPGGSVTGQLSRTFLVNITNFTETPSLDGAVAISVAYNVTGAVTRATV